jgi:hypothetical protein
VRRPNSEPLAPERIGEQALWRSETAMTRALRVRARPDDGSVFDVAFAELVADPIESVRRIYGWLGASLDPGAEASMRRWLAENPRDRHGAHDYDPGFFGLTPERVRARFGRYLDRFEPLCAPGSVT